MRVKRGSRKAERGILSSAKGQRAKPAKLANLQNSRQVAGRIDSQKSWHWRKCTEFVPGPRYQLREQRVSYHINLGPKNDDIKVGKGYFWNNNIEISI